MQEKLKLELEQASLCRISIQSRAKSTVSRAISQELEQQLEPERYLKLLEEPEQEVYIKK